MKVQRLRAHRSHVDAVSFSDDRIRFAKGPGSLRGHLHPQY